jgi:hypothetical protein
LIHFEIVISTCRISKKEGVEHDDTLTLTDAGIPRDLSSRAQRKLGQILQAAKAAGEITHHVRGDVVEHNDNIVRLNETGISRDLSSRAPRGWRMAAAAGRKAGSIKTTMTFKLEKSAILQVVCNLS